MAFVSSRTEQDTVDLMAEIVARRELHGQSYAQIGEALAIPASTAHYLYKTRPEGTGKRVAQVSVEQRRFIRGLIEGKDEHTAALDAGVEPRKVKRFLTEAESSGGFRTLFEREMDRQGLSTQYLLRQLKRLVHAKKDHVLAFHGKHTETVSVPDNVTRLQAVRTALKIRGAGDPKRDEMKTGRTMTINLSPDRQEWVRKVSNRPLEALAGVLEPQMQEQPRDKDGKFASTGPAKEAKTEWEDDEDVIVEL